MLFDTFTADLTASMKSGDKVRVETLRMLISAIRNSAIAKYGNEAQTKLTDADVLDVVKKQVKSRKESIEAFTAAGRTELADKEKAEMAVLEAFLPKQMSDEDIRTLLTPIAASGEKNMGLLMKQAMAAVAGQADGKRVSEILKSLLV